MSGSDEHRVSLVGKTGCVELAAMPGERILLAGLRQGLELPYECATGTCGECRAEVVSGPCDMLWREAPAAARHRPNQILMCQASVHGDAVLRVAGPVGHRSAGACGYHDACLVSVNRIGATTAVAELCVQAPFEFAGGQFVLLSVPGVAGLRAYSIANYPLDDRRLRLIIRRKPGGGISEWLFQNQPVGVPVELFGPLGVACLDVTRDSDLLLIAGGSGISAAMGVIEHALAAGHLRTNSGKLYFGVRHAGDAFFGDVLERYVRQAAGKLQVTVAFSEGDASDAARARYPSLRFETGYVHEAALRTLRPVAAGTTAFLAGPPPMVESAIRMLMLEARIPPTNIRYDKFT